MRSYTPGSNEKLLIRPNNPSVYYILVRSYKGQGDFTLKATLS